MAKVDPPAPVEEGPNFDGSTEVPDNMAATDAPPAEDGDTLRVRYSGFANVRTFTRQDLSGTASNDAVSLTFAPGSEVPYEWWLEMAGSDDRAKEVLRAHAHEFSVVGPGADEFWAEDDGGEEEFSIEGPVKE